VSNSGSCEESYFKEEKQTMSEWNESVYQADQNRRLEAARLEILKSLNPLKLRLTLFELSSLLQSIGREFWNEGVHEET